MALYTASSRLSNILASTLEKVRKVLCPPGFSPAPTLKEARKALVKTLAVHVDKKKKRTGGRNHKKIWIGPNGEKVRAVLCPWLEKKASEPRTRTFYKRLPNGDVCKVRAKAPPEGYKYRP
jgi:hypothetical protein